MTVDTERVPPATRLREVIAELATMGDGPRVRLARAEAEFRLAVAPQTAPAEGIALLRSAIGHDPFQPKLYLHLGRLLQRGGRHRAAVAEYRHVLALAPASRRGAVLLAQALLELDRPERDIAAALIAGLSAGSAEQVRAAVADLDALLAEQASGRRRKTDAAEADGAAEERPAGAPGRGAARRRARRTQPGAAPDPSANGGSQLWRMALVTELSEAKPQPGRIAACLDAGSAELARTGPTEYAVACLLLLAVGHPPEEIRRRVDAAGLDQAGSHPAVGMLLAVLEVAGTADPDAFVAAAGRYVARGVIPATVCCWLHFERCGPQTDLPATRAMRLLDAYPAQLRDQDWYRELRIAVLDGYARRAWTAGRYAEARLLWQESARLDPYRLPVAVNLLLVAARTRATDGYAPAWERLLELLYLLPAGAGDVQLHLAERRDLHLAVSQQSSRRYWSGSGLGPTSDELDAWLADPDALRTWLVEWDRWYLNARLSFRSPLHLLGMALDASAPAVVEARDGLLGQVDRAVGGQPWAGVAVFRELTGAVVTDAFEQAREPVERLRDAHHEPESDRAEALDEELLRRTFTLRQLLGAVARAEQPGEHLALACDIARRLFTPPRSAVHAVWAGANVIEQDDDLTEILEVGLINVAAQWDRPEPADPAGWTRRLSGLDECVALLPHRIEPRLLRCEAQYRAGRPAEAYAGALDALGLPPRGDDDEAIRTRLVDLVDEAGFTDVPESLRQPRDLPTLDRAVAAASSSLGRYPRSGLLRRFLVQLLLAGPAQDRYRRSARLLVAGIADALDDRQRDRCHELFDRIPQADATAAVRQEVTRIKQAADDRLNNAVDALRRDPERVELRATIREVVATELPRVVRTAELARRSRLAMESRQLEETANRLRQIDERLRTGGG